MQLGYEREVPQSPAQPGVPRSACWRRVALEGRWRENRTVRGQVVADRVARRDPTAAVPGACSKIEATLIPPETAASSQSQWQAVTSPLRRRCW